MNKPKYTILLYFYKCSGSTRWYQLVQYMVETKGCSSSGGPNPESIMLGLIKWPIVRDNNQYEYKLVTKRQLEKAMGKKLDE